MATRPRHPWLATDTKIDRGSRRPSPAGTEHGHGAGGEIAPAPRARRWLSGWRAQLGLFVAAYLLYGLARWLTTSDFDVAAAHARWIHNLQRSLGIAVEASVQRALEGSAWLWLLNHAYLAAQFAVTPAMLVWLYRRARPAYRRLRDTILATWLLSIPVYGLFPVAPPRLAEIGMLDTITQQTGLALNSRLATSLYNPLAAVPSLHAGFALAVAVVAWPICRTWWARAAWASWPALVGLSVIATGNHFLFDIAAGFVVTGLGALIARRLDVQSLDHSSLQLQPLHQPNAGGRA